MLRNVKLLISYHGASFLGWQNSIEKRLTMALEKVLQERVWLLAASRTDRGVHARGQVVQFFTNGDVALQALQRALNALLDPSLVVLSVEEMGLSFHPTLDAVKKEYHYQILHTYNPFERDRAWYLPQPLDLSLMREGCAHLQGEHDFSSLTNARKDLTEKEKWCRLDHLSIERRGEGLSIVLMGDRFLYKMARNIVGLLVAIGKGRIKTSKCMEILQKKSRKEDFVTAPAHGLSLIQVYYPARIC